MKIIRCWPLAFFLLGTSLTLRAEPLNDPLAIRVLLAADQETTLVSQMPGTIEVLNASLGRSIKKGEKLVELNCAEARARAQMAAAEVAGAQETLRTKSELRKLNAVGDSELNLVRSAAERAAAGLALTQAQARYCALQAPFSGRIAKVYAKQFQSISAGGPLLDIVSDGPIRLRLNVPSAMLRSLQIGTSFSVSVLETGKQYAAHVSAINSRVDAVAQTLEIEGRLVESWPELLPGMTGTAAFTEH
jgi:membrane fusion protein (multidrug efflux system)